MLQYCEHYRYNNHWILWMTQVSNASPQGRGMAPIRCARRLRGVVAGVPSRDDMSSPTPPSRPLPPLRASQEGVVARELSFRTNSWCCSSGAAECPGLPGVLAAVFTLIRANRLMSLASLLCPGPDGLVGLGGRSKMDGILAWNCPAAAAEVIYHQIWWIPPYARRSEAGQRLAASSSGRR